MRDRKGSLSPASSYMPDMIREVMFGALAASK